MPRRFQPLALSAMGFSFLSSAPISQLLVVDLDFSFQEGMLWLTLVYILGALAVFFILHGLECTEGGFDQKTTEPRKQELHRNLPVLASWAAGLTILFAFVSFNQLAVSLNVPLQQLRWLAFLPLPLTFIAAPLMQRCGSEVVAGFGLLVASSAFYMAVIFGESGMLIASVLLSSGIAIAVPSLLAIVTSRTPPAKRGLALGIYSFALFLGASIAGPLSHALMGLGLSIALLPAMLALSLATLLLLHLT